MNIIEQIKEIMEYKKFWIALTVILTIVVIIQFVAFWLIVQNYIDTMDAVNELIEWLNGVLHNA